MIFFRGTQDSFVMFYDCPWEFGVDIWNRHFFERRKFLTPNFMDEYAYALWSEQKFGVFLLIL